MRLDRARTALRDLMAIPPDVMASDWLTDKQGNAVELVRSMGQQLLAYADAMEAARPQRLRLVKEGTDAS
jgi:hypothetical protein